MFFKIKKIPGGGGLVLPFVGHHPFFSWFYIAELFERLFVTISGKYYGKALIARVGWLRVFWTKV